MNVVIVAQSHPPLADPETVRASWPFKPGDVSLPGLGVALDSPDHTVGDLTLKSAQIVL
jgi:hypothetical protein